MAGIEQGQTGVSTQNETGTAAPNHYPIRRFFGRVGLVLALAAGVSAAVETAGPAGRADATTVFNNDYPDGDAMLRDITTYDWWKDEDSNGVYSGSGESNSSRGYAYRNCTDGAAYWVKKYTGVTIPVGWGNAKTWDDNAAGYSVYDGASVNSIEPGDIAQSDDGTYGHVGFVTGVTKDGNGVVTAFEAAEMNKNADGTYTLTTYNSKNALGKFSRSGSYDWDHFIDVNGMSKGLNNEDLGAGGVGGGSTPGRPVPGDFDGNGYTNSAIFRPSDGYWHVRGDAGGGAGGDYQYGQAGDIPVPADYNGDGKTDVAVFRPSTGDWHIRGVGDFNYGQAGDIPVPGDYNGDGKADIAVYRPSQSVGGENAWHIRGVGDFYFGHVGDIPSPGYYNNDANLDIGVYRPGDGGWHIRGVGDWPHGVAGDIPVQGDYNGDGITDSAIYRPGDGGWRVRAVGDWPYGVSTDIPVPGRYNNDKLWDSAVYRPGEGGWHVRGVGDWPYGVSTDIPAVQTLNAMLLKQYALISTY